LRIYVHTIELEIYYIEIVSWNRKLSK